MNKVVVVIFILVGFAPVLTAQTYTFECFCGYLTPADANCDVCNTTTQSRYFKGLLIRKNGTPFKWIEQPYTVLQNFDALTFKELVPMPEQIRIELSGTAYSTIAGFRDSTMCPCEAGGGGTTLIAGPGVNIFNDTIAAIPQQIDTFDLVSGAQDTLRLSLTRDSAPYHFVILPPDADNQYIDTLRLTGTTLGISLSGDGQPLKTVDLSSLVADGSETYVKGANGIVVTGTGTVIDPYEVAMPAGTSSQTLRHTGFDWSASSLLLNDGNTIGINTTPSASYLLKVKQNGTSSSTTGLAVERAGSTNVAWIYHDGSATFRSGGGNNLRLLSESGSLINLVPGGGGGQQSQVQVAPGANVTANLGNAAMVNIFGTYAATAAGGDFSMFRLGSTFNISGSGNQIAYGLKITPTLTSIPSGFYGVEYVPTTNNFLDQPSGTGVVSHIVGNLGIGSGTTSPAGKLQIIGNGSTSSTYPLIVTNSTGTTSTAALTVRDDSRVGVGTNAPARKLHVEGEARITDVTTDPAITLIGVDADGDVAAVPVTGASITGGTLVISGSDGNGIYGDGTAGSGDDALPTGGSTVTVPGENQGLTFELNTAGGEVWTAITVTTPYSSDDAFSKYFVGKAPADSLLLYSYDGASYVKAEGGNLNVQSTNQVLVNATNGTVVNGTGTEFTVNGEAVFGQNAAAPLANQTAHAAGRFTSDGDAQASEIVIRRSITGTSAAELFLDGSSAQAILPATNRVWTGTAKCSGAVTSVGNGSTIVVGDAYAKFQTFTIKRIGSTTTLMTAVMGLADTWADANMGGAAFTLSADDTTEALKITFTPPTLAGSTTVCKAVCTVQLNELGF